MGEALNGARFAPDQSDRIDLIEMKATMLESAALNSGWSNYINVENYFSGISF
jgi:hypothetical protein